MIDENIAKWLLFVAIIVFVAIVSGVLFLLSAAKFRGWQDGRRANELYHRHTVDVLKGRIEAREYALAMSMDMLATLCDNISDCKYCPYGCDDYSRKCALWELSEQVDCFGIKKVHVDTRHEGGDGH